MHRNKGIILENPEVYDDFVLTLTILTDIGVPILDIEKP